MLETESNREHFAYDKLYRLTEVQDGSGTMVRRWTYDGIGNRLTEETPVYSGGGGGDQDRDTGGSTSSGGIVNYTYAPDSHRLVDVGGQPRTYDAVGNTRQKGDLELIYSDANRLSEVRRGVSTVGRYTYNGLGQRVVKEAGGATVQFLYDESGKLLFEFDNTTGFTEYVWLENLLIGVIQNGQPFAIETDHLGTPRLATNAYGSVAWRWTQWDNAFGDYPADSVGDSDGAALELNLRFPGQYYDSESGLHYNYFRDYEPHTGRYVQSDPIGIYGGINTWIYAKKSPLIFNDRFGLSPNDFSDMSFSSPFPGIDWVCINLGLCPGHEMQFESEKRFQDWVDCHKCEIRCVQENLFGIQSIALTVAGEPLSEAARRAARTSLQLSSAVVKRVNLYGTTYGALMTITCIKDCG